MVSALDSGSGGPGSSPGEGLNCEHYEPRAYNWNFTVKHQLVFTCSRVH